MSHDFTQHSPQTPQTPHPPGYVGSADHSGNDEFGFVPAAEVDQQAAAAVTAAMSSTERGRSFGRLIDAAAFMAACQAKVPAEPLRQPRVVVFYADPADATAPADTTAADAGTAPDDQSRTNNDTVADDIAAGGAPVATLARTHGVGVRVERISADSSEHASTTALEFGRQIADSEIDAGADILIPGELSEDISLDAAALFGIVTKTEPVALLSLETSGTTSQWQHDVAAVRDQMFHCRGANSTPLETIRHFGSRTAQALVGFILQAAARRTPVLVDGCLATVCGLVAEKINPGTKSWLRSSQLSPEPAHMLAVQKLELTPLLAFDLTTGQGTGGILALSALNAAIELVSDEVYAITDAVNAQTQAEAGSSISAESRVGPRQEDII